MENELKDILDSLLGSDVFKVRKKQYYYHVSFSEIQDKIWFPRSNSESLGRGYYEPDVSRICVCPTVHQCCAAIANEIFSRSSNLYAYRTAEKVEAYYPYNVGDSKITSERWLLKPTMFVLVKKFDNDCLQCFPTGGISVGSGIKREEKLQIKFMGEVKNVFNRDWIL